MIEQLDTIAAIATPPGTAGIGVIRVSGANAIPAAQAIFKPLHDALANTPARQLIRGNIYDNHGKLLDQALAVIMPAGQSYTGEDVVELHCHGSPILLQLVLDLLFAQSVRLAEAGEFTRRAFLNNCLDLTQAEAVHDLITAPNEAAVRNAAGQLDGLLARQLDALWAALTGVCAHFYACLDYPDDGVIDLDIPTLTSAIRDIHTKLSALAATHSRGRKMRDGIKTAIVGRPNVGKSSLLNALLGYERAIVSPTAGTTRDTVSETITLNGSLFRVIDTAGLRDGCGEVEQLGIERTQRTLQEADLLLIVLDGSQPLTVEDKTVLALAHERTIIVVNKIDRTECKIQNAEYAKKSVRLSALTGEGIDGLADAMSDLFNDESIPSDGTILTNARQSDAIRRAATAVDTACHALENATPDAVIFELETALEALGQLTGKLVQVSIVDEVFGNFCVGK
ncbi:MAG: tRNA uridine-5-carboxymethylaminomethyl(34) synthesis GTPase MnmE [Oscillospiraceae bacterium]|nr:tRNA uridine-5-carboxymethylaminomethyl(34) synthesis GTPase MnmE [Oscillospiraceae bacterium]